MAANLIHSLNDDSPDLPKGCMGSFLQLFDRHQALGGQRQKRISSGDSLSVIIEPDNNVHSQKNSVESRLNSGVTDKPRIPSEPRTYSFASSSSSGSSPLDCRMMPPREACFEHLSLHESLSKDLAWSQSIYCSQLSCQSLGLRDAVKDSIYRGVGGLSVKATSVEEPKNYFPKRKGFPRTQSSSNSVDIYFNEIKELPRPSYKSKGEAFVSVSKDVHRFSCDGFSFEPQNPSKATSRLKEQPRLSLDGRERPTHDKKLDSHSRNSERQPPGVVAKLMGLEALPRDHEDCEGHLVSLRTNNDSIQFSSMSRSSSKDSASPKWKNPDLAKKPTPNSRIPIEPAPWKQTDRFKHAKASTSLFPTFYDEMEKRLKDIEYQQSGNDVKALTQILEAMNKKLLHETGEEHLKTGPQRGHLSPNQNQRFTSQQKLQSDHPIGFAIPGANLMRIPESPIVIMKPSRPIQKSGVPVSSMMALDDLSDFNMIQEGEFAHRRKGLIHGHARKDRNHKIRHKEKANTKNSSSMQKHTRIQQTPHENVKGSFRNPESICPRLHQKKLEIDGQAQMRNRHSDLRKLTRQPCKRPTESSVSPVGKLWEKSCKLQPSDDWISEISCESRNMSDRGDGFSVQSDGFIMSDSMIDVENPEIEHSDGVSGNQSPPGWNGVYLSNKSFKPMLSEKGSPAELATTACEHPSPVSVLDVPMDIYDTTSFPVKQLTHSFKDDGTSDGSCEEQQNSVDNSVIRRKKLQSVDNLVQKLKRLNSSHDETGTDYIASLCENPNPDHRYISEILLASGLLLQDLGSDPTACQFHPSGHPINPDLFFVLEQTKNESSPGNFHRRLIFDTVNEVLTGVFGSCELSCRVVYKGAMKRLTAQKLLGELCREIEGLRPRELGDGGLRSTLWDDVMRRERWTELRGEVDGMVLAVERSIFKDLVDEILFGEAAVNGRHCRHLLSAW